jgi:hypothetical protein
MGSTETVMSSVRLSVSPSVRLCAIFFISVESMYQIIFYTSDITFYKFLVKKSFELRLKLFSRFLHHHFFRKTKFQLQKINERVSDSNIKQYFPVKIHFLVVIQVLRDSNIRFTTLPSSHICLVLQIAQSLTRT